MGSITTATRNYLTAYEPFQVFGVAHMLTVAATFFLSIGLPWFAKRHLTQQQRLFFGVVLGSIVAGNYVVWIGLEAVAGTFRLNKHLPLHPCWIANLALPIAIATRARLALEVIFYWGIAAGVQSTLTPTLDASFPHFYYFHYVLAHNGMLVTLIYVIAVFKLRPTASNIWIAFLAGNIFLLLAIPLNVLLDANYFFLCQKPQSPTLVDSLGPWPWYIVAGEFVALLHFAVAYLPIWIWNRVSPPPQLSAPADS